MSPENGLTCPCPRVKLTSCACSVSFISPQPHFPSSLSCSLSCWPSFSHCGSLPRSCRAHFPLSSTGPEITPSHFIGLSIHVLWFPLLFRQRESSSTKAAN